MNFVHFKLRVVSASRKPLKYRVDNLLRESKGNQSSIKEANFTDANWFFVSGFVVNRFFL